MALYYNKATDKAFRVQSEGFGKSWCKEVSISYGRAKMYAQMFPMPTEELNKGIENGTIYKLYSEKTISRDVQFIRGGLPMPKPEVKQAKLKTGKPKNNFTFKVGSLVDENPSDYVAICNQYGEIIGHEYNGRQFTHEQKAEELIEEIKNEKQLSIF